MRAKGQKVRRLDFPTGTGGNYFTRQGWKGEWANQSGVTEGERRALVYLPEGHSSKGEDKLEACTGNLGVQQFAPLHTRQEMPERRRTRVWTNRGAEEPCLNQQVEPAPRMSAADENDLDHLIVPRPRHLGSASVSVLKITKPRCRRSGLKDKAARPEVDEQAGREILDIFLAKNGYTDSPPFLGCSPPSRSGNPLIHDVYFVQTRPIGSPPGQSNRALRGSPTPNIRVEGFFSPSRLLKGA